MIFVTKVFQISATNFSVSQVLWCATLMMVTMWLRTKAEKVEGLKDDDDNDHDVDDNDDDDDVDDDDDDDQDDDEED